MGAPWSGADPSQTGGRLTAGEVEGGADRRRGSSAATGTVRRPRRHQAPRRIIRGSRAFEQQVTEPFQASKSRVEVPCPKDGAKRVPAARRKEPRSRKSRHHIGCQLSFRKGSHQQQGLAVLLLKARQGFPDLELGFAPCQPETTPVPLKALGPWPAHGRVDTKYPRFRVPFEKRTRNVGSAPRLR
jgi:hypothetical protein